MQIIDSLAAAIMDFADLTCDLTDTDLDKLWAWRDNAEGVRFAFFRNSEISAATAR